MNQIFKKWACFLSILLTCNKLFILNHCTLDQLSMFIGNMIKESNNFSPISVDLYRQYIIVLKLTNNIEFENKVNEIRVMISSYHTLFKQNFEDTYR